MGVCARGWVVASGESAFVCSDRDHDETLTLLFFLVEIHSESSMSRVRLPRMV